MVNFISVVNAVNGSCPWLKQPIPCDFDLYTNSTSLTDSQKLLPNTDVTGTNVMIMFGFTTSLAALLSILLLVDETLLLLRAMSKKNYAYYRRLIHTMDTLLHSLSDTQVVAGLAMLIVASFHASCISAYHYNVVCYLMLMSLITHILAFVNVPEFCSKNTPVGLARVSGIIAILCLTWELFKARDAVDNFPVDPSSLAIMPAACFVGNQSSVLGGSYFDTHNVSQILGITGKGEGSKHYKLQFIPLGIAGIIGLLFLIGDSIKALEYTTNSPHWRRWLTVALRTIITLWVIILGVVASLDYLKLRRDFEVDAFYVSSDEDTTSLSQLITLTLSTTSLFAVLKVVFESIEGPRSANAVDKIFNELDGLKSHISDVEEYGGAIKNQVEEQVRFIR